MFEEKGMTEKKMDLPTPVVGDNEIDYLMDCMRHICNDIGFRSPGSEGEKKGAEYFKQEYTKWADEVHEEHFQIAPDAYPSAMIRPLGWFFSISVIGFFTFPRFQ